MISRTFSEFHTDTEEGKVAQKIGNLSTTLQDFGRKCQSKNEISGRHETVS
jgi:hypothetical protein